MMIDDSPKKSNLGVVKSPQYEEDWYGILKQHYFSTLFSVLGQLFLQTKIPNGAYLGMEEIIEVQAVSLLNAHNTCMC